MIFNSALLFALYKFTNKSSINFDLHSFFKVFIILLITFIISVYLVNHLRSYYYEMGAPLENPKNIIKKSNILDNGEIKEQKILDIPKDHTNLINKDQELNKKLTIQHEKQSNFLIYNNSVLNLIIYRWVGIEAVLIVTRDKVYLILNFLNNL